MSQQAVEAQNAEFWDTLCGWNLAQAAGITGRHENDLRRFDELYLGFYPYLESYVPEDFGGKKVLEVGLGYGTLGQLIASRNADYYGADIAQGPVANMRQRLSWLGLPEDHAVQASVLELPFADAPSTTRTRLGASTTQATSRAASKRCIVCWSPLAKRS